jgi:hypothetical protein
VAAAAAPRIIRIEASSTAPQWSPAAAIAAV